MKKKVIQIKPISLELSENTKKYLEWLEWANKSFYAYTNSLFMIK